MNSDFPFSYQSFKSIHEMCNQRTLAHYKDKSGKPRIKITSAEYTKFLENAHLDEIYSEIYEYFKNKPVKMPLTKKKLKINLSVKKVKTGIFVNFIEKMWLYLCANQIIRVNLLLKLILKKVVNILNVSLMQSQK